MATIKTDLERRLYDALKRITHYQTPAQLLRNAEKDWGCSGSEALEMAIRKPSISLPSSP